MRRLLLAPLLLLGGVWLLFRSVQWERRKGFHGRYEQPIDAWREAGLL